MNNEQKEQLKKILLPYKDQLKSVKADCGSSGLVDYLEEFGGDMTEEEDHLFTEAVDAMKGYPGDDTLYDVALEIIRGEKKEKKPTKVASSLQDFSKKELKMIQGAIKMVYDEPELDSKSEAKTLLSLIEKLGITPKSIHIDNPQEFLADFD